MEAPTKPAFLRSTGKFSGEMKLVDTKARSILAPEMTTKRTFATGEDAEMIQEKDPFHELA